MNITSIKYHSTDNNQQDERIIVWFEVKVQFNDDQESSEFYSGLYGVMFHNDYDPVLVDRDGCPETLGTNWVTDKILDSLIGPAKYKILFEGETS